jgi:hypothetical protein
MPRTAHEKDHLQPTGSYRHRARVRRREPNGQRPSGVDLDAAYVGLGTEADFMGRDVKGKAVFTYSMQGLRNEGAVGARMPMARP